MSDYTITADQMDDAIIAVTPWPVSATIDEIRPLMLAAVAADLERWLIERAETLRLQAAQRAVATR